MEIDCNEGKDRRFLSWPKKILAGQRGSLMVEVTVALVVLGSLGTALMAGVQTGHMAKRNFETQSLAENIIRNQMEHVFELAYVPPPTTYSTVALPPDYTATAEALVYDATSPNIETIRVTVFKRGQPVKAIETLRANR
ncbi:MAG: type II secretion system protein [Dehalococcoidia bacterium]|nr:type II secretion system protein [Dehalococcoidia bacterium]